MLLTFNTLSKGNSDYYGFYVGQKTIKNALNKCGVSFSEDTGHELYHCGAHLYNKNLDKKSILYTPHESDSIHPMLIKKMNEADIVVATCKHNLKVFKDNGVTKPLFLCTQGIDFDIYNTNKEKDITRNCRFLWIGQNNIRKGWDIVVQAFKEEFTPDEPAELYIKTTANELQDYNKYEIFNGKITFDCRNLPVSDMLDIYDSSHIFCFPSRGEALGLPAIEAMAMGLLVLAPPVTAMEDYINSDTAIPLEYDIIRGNYGVDTDIPNVKIESMRYAMRYAFENYTLLQHKIKFAKQFVKQYYDINDTAKTLIDIIFN